MIYENCASMARNAIDWFRVHNYKPPLPMTFFNWDRSHTHGRTHTHTQNIPNAILTPFIAIMIPRSRNVSNFNSLQSQAKIFIGLESFWSFFSPPFFRPTTYSCCYCRRISLQIPTYYGFNNAGHYLIVYLYIFSSLSKQNLMSHVSWSNFNVCFFHP